MRFWINTELFEFGLVPLASGQNWFTFDKLIKIAREFAAFEQILGSNTTQISYVEWRSLCQKQIPSFTEKHARLLFDYFIIHTSHSCANERKYAADETAQGDTVNLHQFLVFLLLHQYYLEKNLGFSSSPARKSSPLVSKSSPIGSNLMYKLIAESSSEDKENDATDTNQPSIISNVTAMTAKDPAVLFVKRHISDILKIIAPSSDKIKRSEFDILDFLFAGGNSYQVVETRLSSSTPFWQYSSRDNGYNQKDIAEWICNNLTVNTHLYPSPSTTPSTIHTHMASPPKLVSSNPLQKLSTTSHDMEFAYFETSYPLLAPVVIQQVSRKTLLKTDQDLGITSKSSKKSSRHTHVRMSKCEKSFIYILARTSFVSIVDCIDCTIVVGAVEKGISMQNCSNVTIIAITKSIRINSSTNCTIHVCCNTNPLIIDFPINNSSGAAHPNIINLLPKDKWKSFVSPDVENQSHNHSSGNAYVSCSHITLAPYNTFYPLLQYHLDLARINVSSEYNFWNQPLVLSPSIQSDSDENQSSDENLPSSRITCTIMKSKQFHAFAIPFDLQNEKDMNVIITEKNPVELPLQYEQSIQERNILFPQLKERLCGLSDVQSAEVNKIIEEKFWDWLKESGNMKQIQYLDRLKLK